MGLLSLIDAMLEMPMHDILERISLDHGDQSRFARTASPLQPVFQLILAHESGSGSKLAKSAVAWHWIPRL